MNFNIISDSCLDNNESIFGEQILVERVPFKVMIDGTEHEDVGSTISDELDKINFKAKKISTACPSPNDFQNAFKEVKDTFIVAISSGLSGSYQSALAAKDMIEEKVKNMINVHVFDSKSAATGQDLIVLKIKELIDLDLSYAAIVNKTTEYISKMKTIFSLESLDTLVSNGRVHVAKQYLTKAFKLFPILEATDEGKIAFRTFARGQQNAVAKLVDTIGEVGKDLSDKILGITHVNAPEKAEFVKKEAEAKYNFKDIIIFEAGGLSTVYGSNKGIILAF